MGDFDLNAPATLFWVSRELPRERPFLSVKDAARFAMAELKRGEFFAATIATADDVFSGDQIVQIHQKGGVAPRKYAWF